VKAADSMKRQAPEWMPRSYRSMINRTLNMDLHDAHIKRKLHRSRVFEATVPL